MSPLLRSTRIVTTAEKAYTGIIIYEATDGVILQTGCGHHCASRHDADIASKKKQMEVSLMPTGLIDALSDAGCRADLLARLGVL